MIDLLIGFANANPAVASVLMVMGVLKAVMHPIFAVAHAYTEATADPADDAKLAEIEDSKVVKTLYAVLDYATSIKLK